MIADNKFTKDHGKEEHILKLTDVAITLTSCAANVQETTKTEAIKFLICFETVAIIAII